MSSPDIDQLNAEQRQEAAAWLERELESVPEFFRPVLKSMLTHLAAGQVSQKQFNAFSRQLGRALGFIPRSEKRKSGDPLGSLNAGVTRRPKNERERLEQQLERSKGAAEGWTAMTSSRTGTRQRPTS